MAGNPYTESGEVFRIPDMLANRADIYNLGDILGGMESLFPLSYIENGLTSNPVLAPLATRDMADLYLLVARRGRGSPGERAQARLHRRGDQRDRGRAAAADPVRDVVLRVNQQYIASPPRRTPTASSRRSSCRAATAT